MRAAEGEIARDRCATAVGAVQTHKGLVRENNEDSYVFDLPRGRFAVIDGMGGQHAGEVAAALVRESLLREEHLPRAIHRANQEIFQRAAANDLEHGMGCVVTAVQVTDGRLQIAHVGDTRAYLARENGCRLLTRDHTTVADRQQDLVLSDAVARTLPGRHQVTRDVGGLSHADESWILTGYEPFEPGDLLLLCSDGLHDLVPSDELYGLLRVAKTTREEPSALVRRLIQLALERGGKDNVTVLAVRRESSPAPAAGKGPARAGRAVLPVAVGAAALLAGFLLGAVADRFWWNPRTAAPGLVDTSHRPRWVAAGPAGLDGELQPGTLDVLGKLEASGGTRTTAVLPSAFGREAARIRGMALGFPADGRHEWRIAVAPGAELELVQASIRAPNLVLRLELEGPRSRVRILDSHLEIERLIIEGDPGAAVELRGGFLGVGQAGRLETTPGPLVLRAPYPPTVEDASQ